MMRPRSKYMTSRIAKFFLHLAPATVLLVYFSAIGRLYAKSPEARLKESMASLEELKSKIQSLKLTSQPLEEAKTNRQLQTIFENAQQNFNDREWSACIRTLNHYLNASQAPDPSYYLKAHYMLGVSYENLQNYPNAMRAYLRYLATFISEKDYSKFEISDVLQAILNISQFSSQASIIKMRELFASLASIELPDELKAQSLFYNALTSSDLVNLNYSLEWYEKAYELSKDERLKAQIQYFSGVLLAKRGNIKAAEERLSQVASLTDEHSQDYRDLAKVGLARIAVLSQRPQLAIEHYKTVDETSPQYKQAVFESIYVYADLKKYDEALESIAILEKQFAHSYENLRAQRLKALISINNYATDTARQSIETQSKRLSDTQKTVSSHLSYKERLTEEDLRAVALASEGLAPQPFDMQKANHLFKRINQLRLNATTIRSEIRSLVMTLGRLTADNLQPSFNSQIKQAEQLTTAALNLGWQLVLVDYQYFKDQLKAAQEVEFKKNTDRWQKILEQNPAILRQKHSWRSWVKLTELIQHLANAYTKLFETKARTASLMLINQNTDDSWTPIYRDILRERVERAHRLERSIIRGVEIVRARQSKDLISQSDHIILKRRLLSLTQLLYDTRNITRELRDHTESSAARLMVSDLDSAWSQWEFVTRSLYEAIHQSGEQLSRYMEETLARLDVMVKDSEYVRRELQKIEGQLQIILGKNAGKLLSHYKYHLNREQTRLKKWSADLHWVELLKNRSARRLDRDNFEKKTTTIKGELKDIEEGVR